VTADNQTSVTATWEALSGLTTYQVKIHDHDQTFESEIQAVDVRYAQAQILIEQHIYISSADGIEITAVGTQVAEAPLVEADLEFKYFHAPEQSVIDGPWGVDVTHLPTGQTFRVFSERSQLANKAEALRRLQAWLRTR